ncbi:MAG: transcriptional repressor LexA [Clostridia bacterium]|nr:transcriptional repressor LexA [Clostridia bacterium]
MDIKLNSQNKEKVYEFLFTYIQKNTYPPSIREICKALNFSSTSTASYYLRALESDDRIIRNKFKNRAIEIVSKKNEHESITVPILGSIAAGIPISAIENKEGDVTISNKFFNGTDLFILHVKGDSMVNAGILNSDYIVVNKQNVANNGEIIVAMIDGDVTVKRFYKENNFFRLQPENNLMQHIYIDHVEILGKVVGIIRNFR